MFISYPRHPTPFPATKTSMYVPKARLLKKILGCMGKSVRLPPIPLLPSIFCIGTYTVSSKKKSTSKLRVLSNVLASNPSLLFKET